MLSLFEEPIHFTRDKYFPDVRNALQKFTLNGDPFMPEYSDTKNENVKKFDKAFRKMLDIDLSNEIEQLASDEFYSWYSGEDYVLDKIKGQLLILQSERLPQYLSNFVNEIRECFIFQNYIAAFVLCRTVFEIAIRDLTQKKRLLNENSKNWEYVKNYMTEQLDKNDMTLEKYMPSLKVRIDLLSLLPSFEKLKSEMHNLRIEGNRVIHANKIVKKSDCKNMIKSTFWIIHELYEIN